MRLSLHPDSRCAAATSIDAVVTRPHGDALELRYLVTGQIAALALPPVTAPTRANELWKHTCFEVFVRPAADHGYFEFNFSPSTQWAAYRFDGYREGMNELEISAPRIEVQAGAGRYEMRVQLDLPDWPEDSMRLGLSAVIEENDGGKSYWALAHPAGKPDFHHPDCFALELGAPERP